MNKDIADLWIAELESGAWAQGKVFLEHSDYYCVMGILANIAAGFGICSHTGSSIGLFDGKLNIVPNSVVEWAGLRSVNGEIPGLQYTLAEYNDRDKSFKELAHIIKRHWESL